MRYQTANKTYKTNFRAIWGNIEQLHLSRFIAHPVGLLSETFVVHAAQQHSDIAVYAAGLSGCGQTPGI